MLARLPSDVFDVTYIHFSDHGRADAAEYDSGYLRELGVTDFVYITMEGDDWRAAEASSAGPQAPSLLPTSKPLRQHLSAR